MRPFHVDEYELERQEMDNENPFIDKDMEKESVSNSL